MVGEPNKLQPTKAKCKRCDDTTYNLQPRYTGQDSVSVITHKNTDILLIYSLNHGQKNNIDVLPLEKYDCYNFHFWQVSCYLSALIE